jgi:hypothetical protein
VIYSSAAWLLRCGDIAASDDCSQTRRFAQQTTADEAAGNREYANREKFDERCGGLRQHEYTESDDDRRMQDKSCVSTAREPLQQRVRT